MNLFIRESQLTYFRDDYLSLYNDSRIESSSKLKTFDPALNNNGVMCCQTRLDNLNEDLQQLVAIHPILLVGNAFITQKKFWICTQATIMPILKLHWVY